jgi:hypothetical protein
MFEIVELTDAEAVVAFQRKNRHRHTREFGVVVDAVIIFQQHLESLCFEDVLHGKVLLEIQKLRISETQN